MTVGCAGCGRCCEDVALPLTPDEYAAMLERLAADGRSMSRAAAANAEWFADHFTVVGVGEDGNVRATCDAYDPESKLCTAHDDRPPVCAGYPWYGDEPGRAPAVTFPSGCSYLWDLPAGHPERGPVVGRLLPLWPAGGDTPAEPALP